MNKKQEKKNLLILTSDNNFSAEIDSSLELRNFDIYKAKSYSEALSLFKKYSADIAFVDIENMHSQEMDLVNYIKTRSPKTEIIILTTVNELDNATYSLHYGASFYLMKPVNGENMKYIIEKLSARITRNSELFEFEHRVLSDMMAGNEEMRKIL